MTQYRTKRTFQGEKGQNKVIRDKRRQSGHLRSFSFSGDSLAREITGGASARRFRFHALVAWQKTSHGQDMKLSLFTNSLPITSF